MAVGTEPNESGTLLDYEQFIDYQLRETRAKIKTTDIVTALVALVSALIGVLLLEVVLDHRVGLPLFVRGVLFYGCLLGSLGVLAWFVVRPLMARINGLYAARTIESADPEFHNSLISYLELRERPEAISPTALAAIEARAVQDLTRVSPDAVVDQRRLIQSCYALAAIVAAFCLYWLVCAKPPGDSIRRALLFDVARPTNTRLVNIKPGDDPEKTLVITGSNVPFAVHSEGVRPAKIVLHYSTDGGKFYSQAEYAPGPERGDPWQTTLRNVQREVKYYLTGGDATSKTFTLNVLPAPMVTSVTHDLEFPKYTGVPPRKGVEGGNIEAIEGTWVTLHAKTNQAASWGRVQFGKAGVEPRNMGTDGDPQSLTGQFPVTEDGSYTIRLKTTDGQVNPDPVVYEIKAIKDQPPTAQFLRPAQPIIQKPSNARVTFEVEAADDFGVARVELNIQRQKDDSAPIIRVFPQEKVTKKFRATDTLDLAPLKLPAGTKLEYWAKVTDNKETSPNAVESIHQIIEIVAPASPQELQKQEEQEKEQQPPPPDQDQQQQPAPTNAQRPDAENPPPQPGDRPQPKGDSNPADQQRQPQGEGHQGQGEKDMTPDQEKELFDKLQRAVDKQQPKNEQRKQQGANDQSNPAEGDPSKGESAKNESANAGPSKGEPSKGERSKGDPSKGDPSKGDPTKGERSKGDPSRGDPTKGDPTKGDPTKGDPSKGDPTKGDPTKGDPSKGDPTKGDPTKGDPSKGDPTKGDPTKGDPSRGDPTKGDTSKGDPSKGDPTKGIPSKGDPSRGDPKKGDPSKGDPTKGDSSKGDPTKGDLSKGDPSKGDLSKGDPSKGDPSKGDPSKAAPTKGGGGNPKGELPKGDPDTSQPSPRAQERAPAKGENINPGTGGGPADFARKVREMLKDEQAAAKLEQDTGMTRSDLEQFVERFEKKARAAGREAGTFEGGDDPGQELSSDPKLPGMAQGSSYGQRVQRGGTTAPKDTGTDNIQGARSVAPARVKSRYDAYLKGLSKSAPSAPSPAPGTPGSGDRR